MKSTFFLSILSALLCHVSAQYINSSIAVNKALPDAVYQLDVAVDYVSGFVYLAGFAQNSVDDQSEYGTTLETFLSKHYPNGSRIWTRFIGGPGSQMGITLVLNQAKHEVYLLGKTDTAVYNGTSILGADDLIIALLAPNGTRLFLSVFGTGGEEWPYQARIDQAKQRLIISAEYNGNIGLLSCSMSNGTLTSVNQFGAAGWARGSADAATANDYFVAGITFAGFDGQPYSGGQDIFLSKTNLNGTRYWSYVWGNTSVDQGNGIAFDPSSGLVFVAGYTNVGLNGLVQLGQDDIFLICVHSNGTYLWTKSYGAASADFANAILLHQPSGNLFIFGTTYSTLPGKVDPSSGWILVVAQNGTYLTGAFPKNADIKSGVFDSTFSYGYIGDYAGNWVTFRISASLNPLPVSSLPAFGAISTVPSSTALYPSTSTQPSAETPKPSVSTQLAPQITTSAKPTSAITPASTESTSYLTFLSSTLIGSDDPNLVTGNPSALSQSLDYATLFVIIISALAVIVLVMGIAVAMWCCRKTAKKAQNSEGRTFMSSEFQDNSTITNNSDISGMSGNTTMTAGMTTMIRSNFELSLPGFLNFPRNESYRVNKKLAEGGGGVVSLAEALLPRLKVHGSLIVVKTIGKEESNLENLSEWSRDVFQQEVSIMFYFRNEKHIAKLLGWSDAPASLLMKFYPFGALDRWIYNAGIEKSKRIQLSFAADIAKGLFAMHGAGFVHCDIKPQNVLIDADIQNNLFCVLTDFGITRVVDDTSLLVKDFAVVSVKGLSVHYAAPEAFSRFRKGGFDNVPGAVVMKIDIYSLAMLILEVFYRRRPWIA